MQCAVPCPPQRAEVSEGPFHGVALTALTRHGTLSSRVHSTDHVTFAEYDNTGPGASGTRASFSTMLSSPVSIDTVLNSTSWIDPSFL